MSMFLYLLWPPQEGSLAVPVISFLFCLLYFSFLASCMGRGNSNSCLSYVIGSWLWVQWNPSILCIGIGLHGWDMAFISKWATCVLSIDLLLSSYETCIILFVYLDPSLCKNKCHRDLRMAWKPVVGTLIAFASYDLTCVGNRALHAGFSCG